MPLHVTPCVDGYVPVRIVARAGWHSGFCVRAAAKRVPCGRERVEARRRAERRALDAERVGALLVGRDQETFMRM